MHHLFHPLPWVHPSHPSILNLHPCQTSKGLLSELYPLSKAKMIWIEARLRQEANSPNKLFFQIEATSDLNKLNQSPYCLYCSDFLVHQRSVTNLFLRYTLDQICEKERRDIRRNMARAQGLRLNFVVHPLSPNTDIISSKSDYMFILSIALRWAYTGRVDSLYVPLWEGNITL